MQTDCYEEYQYQYLLTHKSRKVWRQSGAGFIYTHIYCYTYIEDLIPVLDQQHLILYMRVADLWNSEWNKDTQKCTVFLHKIEKRHNQVVQIGDYEQGSSFERILPCTH